MNKTGQLLIALWQMLLYLAFLKLQSNQYYDYDNIRIKLCFKYLFKLTTMKICEAYIHTDSLKNHDRFFFQLKWECERFCYKIERDTSLT